MADSRSIENLHLAGNSDSMQQLYKMIGRICNADCAILLLGEKGSGKKIVARAIHYFSHRAAAPFQVISGKQLRLSSDEELLGIDESHQTEGTCFISDLTAMPYFMHDRLLTIHRRKQFKCNHEGNYKKHRIRFIVANEGTIQDEMESGELPEDL